MGFWWRIIRNYETLQLLGVEAWGKSGFLSRNCMFKKSRQWFKEEPTAGDQIQLLIDFFAEVGNKRQLDEDEVAAMIDGEGFEPLVARLEQQYHINPIEAWKSRGVDTRLLSEFQTTDMDPGQTINVKFSERESGQASLLEKVIKMIIFKINFQQDEPNEGYASGALEDDWIRHQITDDHINAINKIKLHNTAARIFNVELYNSTCLFSLEGYSYILLENQKFQKWASHLVNEVRLYTSI